MGVLLCVNVHHNGDEVDVSWVFACVNDADTHAISNAVMKI